MIYYIFVTQTGASILTVPSLRRLVTGFSSRRPVFDPRPVDVRFVVDKMTLGQVFLQVLRFSPFSIIPPILHTHLHPHLALTRKTNARSLGTFQKAMFFRKSSKAGSQQFQILGRLIRCAPKILHLGGGADHKVMYILILMLKYNCNITLFATACIQYKYDYMFHDSRT